MSVAAFNMKGTSAVYDFFGGHLMDAPIPIFPQDYYRAYFVFASSLMRTYPATYFEGTSYDLAGETHTSVCIFRSSAQTRAAPSNSAITVRTVPQKLPSTA